MTSEYDKQYHKCIIQWTTKTTTDTRDKGCFIIRRVIIYNKPKAARDKTRGLNKRR